MKIMNKIKLELMSEIKTSPINGKILDIIGVYLLTIFVMGLFVNTLLLVVFARFKQLRTSLNKLILVLTAFNLLGSLELPFVIHSSLVHKYDFVKILKLKL